MTQTGGLKELAALAGQEPRRILGLMSGTSLDGLDLALCQVWGHGPTTRLQVEAERSLPYSREQQQALRAVAFQEQVSLAELTRLHRLVAEWHGLGVLESLANWGVAAETVHCLASHGQTIYHAPASKHPAPDDSSAAGHAVPHATVHATLQIGDGDHLARRTGILTLSDFRQKEIAAGGQGAPLAPYAEALLLGKSKAARLLINLGGIANFSWIPGTSAPGAVISGDTGPANALLDCAVRRFFPHQKEGFDREGRLAAQGTPHAGLLERWKAHPYFALPCPKSTGPETFGEAFLEEGLEAVAGDGGAGNSESEGAFPHDLLATLVLLTVETVAETIRREVNSLAGAELHVSGGGSHNPVLMKALEQALPQVRLMAPDALGFSPDAKEAVLFALLANESLWGSGFAPPGGGGAARVRLGKLSFPG